MKTETGTFGYVLAICALLFGMLLAFNASAEEVKKNNWSLNVKGIYIGYNNPDLREDGKGVKAEVAYKNIYLWGSFEQGEMRLTGQRAGAFSLLGFGPGLKVEVVKGLSLFGELGIYVPKSDLAKDTMAYSEGVHYKWKKILDDVGLPQFDSQFRKYEYELKSGLGGTVGASFDQDLGKGWGLGIHGGYRFLNLKEDWKAYHNTIPNCWIETKEKRDFGGFITGISVSKKF